LWESALSISKGEETESKMKIEQAKNFLFDLIENIIDDQNISAETNKNIKRLFEEISRIFYGVSITKELSPRTLDKILSFGEQVSAIVLQSYLKSRSIDARFIGAEQIIITDENFGAAQPLIEPTTEAVKRNLLPLFKETDIVFTQGFIGTSRNGYPTTMGFESSNLTALILAHILESKEVIFWTDVEGIRSSDPKIVRNTKLIEEISFETAEYLSLNGLKLIYPSMLKFFKLHPLTNYVYRSAFNPQNGFSLIVPKTETITPIILISEKFNLFRTHRTDSLTNQSLNIRQSKIFYASRDSIICLVEFPQQSNISDDAIETEEVAVVTLFNLPIEKALQSIGRLKSEIIFAAVDNSISTIQLIIKWVAVEYVANLLHRELIENSILNKV
jgi:aspartate kinase